jgi:dihydroxy-acid dehydratase
MMMAMVRLNTPSVFIYGGSILPGRLNGQDVTVQDVFEAVGKHQAGNYSDAELDILERVACPSRGACGGQFTANTMACVSEAIGLALPNSSGAPAPYESRDQYCEASGVGGDEPDREEHPRPRHRHPQGAGERRPRRGLHRRLHQCRAAPARHRA